MALNNIANEPRRELTEQGIGVVATILLIILDYKLSWWLQIYTGGSHTQADWNNNGSWPWPTTAILLPPAIFIGFFAVLLLNIGVWYLMHKIGEGVCATLSFVGLEVRPKLRNHEKRFWKYPGTIAHGRQCDYGRKCAVK